MDTDRATDFPRGRGGGGVEGGIFLCTVPADDDNGVAEVDVVVVVVVVDEEDTRVGLDITMESAWDDDVMDDVIELFSL